MHEENDIAKRNRRLPHWTMDGAIYIVTFRVQQGALTTAERLLVMDHIKSGDGRFYKLFAAVVMPDHAHAILSPVAQVELARIMKGIKGVSARLINERRGTRGSVWQDESFDRIIRDAAEFDEKLNYIVNNAVKAELVQEPFDYAALYVGEDL
jgi:putative transposase